MKLRTLGHRLQVATTSRVATLTAKPDVLDRLRGRAGVQDRAAIRARDGGLCQECKRHGVTHLGSKVDHRIPLWDRGTDAPDNKQLMCDRCHEAKSKAEAGLRSRGEPVPRPDGVRVPWDDRANAAVDAGDWRKGIG